MNEESLYSELKRRRVFQVAAIYAAVAWGLTEVTITVVDRLFLPHWIATVAVIAFVVGFPIAVFLAWVFDITPEGIQRTSVTSRRGASSVVLSILALIALTAGLYVLINPAPSKQDTGLRAVSGLHSIAVLPFEIVSSNPEDEYLSSGLSDELRDQLSRVSGFRVAARSSSVIAHEDRVSADVMSAKLGVAALVEGRMRLTGERLRVSIQLIEGKSGLSIWAQTYEVKPKELLRVQTAMVTDITRQLFPGRTDLEVTPPTRNASANELMLLARYHEQRVRAQATVDLVVLNDVIRLYRDATAADPKSALAHSRLGGALLYAGNLTEAEAPIFRALSLDSNLSEVQDTLGNYYWYAGLPGAGNAWARAIELNPNNADALAHYAWWYWLHVTRQGSEALYRRALELDPLSLERYAALGDFLGKEGRDDETRELIHRIDEIFDDTDAMALKSWLYQLAGDLDKSILALSAAHRFQPDNQEYQANLAELFIELGDYDTALQLEPNPSVGLLFKMRRYDMLIDVAEELMIDQPDDLVARYLLAFAYNTKGRYAPAIRILSLSGLPDTVLKREVRLATDLEAFMYLANALYGEGELVLAKELATTWMENFTGKVDWWSTLHDACALIILGRKEEALMKMEQTKQSPRLAWNSILRDSVCFQELSGDPIYESTVDFIDNRRKQLLDRVNEMKELGEFRSTALPL